MSAAGRVITLMTDFGLSDFFVAAMKGVILSINPQAVVVDVTHLVPPQDIETAALTLADCYATFPPGTIHVAVVDPGVGSERRALVVRSERYFFIGPDNGLFSFIYRTEAIAEIRQITATRYFRHPVSRTFHGRDIFAPVAAWLSTGVPADAFGPVINDPVTFPIPSVEVISAHHLRGYVIHVDRFGNLVTNLTEEHVPPDLLACGGKLTIAGREIAAIRTHFEEGSADELFALVGSTGRVEIAVARDSAARLLGVGRGAAVEVLLPAGATTDPASGR